MHAYVCVRVLNQWFWFSAFLALQPFEAVPRAVVTPPTIKLCSLLLYN